MNVLQEEDWSTIAHSHRKPPTTHFCRVVYLLGSIPAAKLRENIKLYVAVISPINIFQPIMLLETFFGALGCKVPWCKVR